MSSQEHYERGMKIQFDRARGTVTVTFRGRIIPLPGRFVDEGPAIRAGERFCMQLGWPGVPKPVANTAHSMMRRPAMLRGI